MTGVAKKYVAMPQQTVSNLSYMAAKWLLEARGIVPKEVGALIQSSSIQYGLLLVGDTMSKVASSRGCSVCMLISDASNPTLLSKDLNVPDISAAFMCSNEGGERVIIPAG